MPPTGIAKIGLTVHPFEETRLDPLAHPDHTSCAPRCSCRRGVIDSVDGFKKLSAGAEIDSALRKAVADDTSVFFMITGDTGVGRKTAASCILARHRELALESLRTHVANSDPRPLESYLVRRFRVGSSDPAKVMGKWFADFYEALQKKAWIAEDKLRRELEDGPKLDEIKLEASCRGLASRAFDHLRGNARTYGVFLEDVPNIQIALTALEIFAEIPTVCVFTVLSTTEQRESLIQPFRKLFRAGRVTGSVVDLKAISGDEVAKVIGARWSAAAAVAQVPNPFDARAVSEAFDDPRPIGRVIRICRIILNSCLDYYDPKDRLEFADAAKLREQVERFETDYMMEALHE